MEIYEEILRAGKEGRPCALATIVECQGSSPQKEGAKMLVRGDGTIIGTLGGGCLEAEVIQTALLAMEEARPRRVPIELTERKGGLICGGRVVVFIEPYLPEPHVAVIGAGHVGRALAAAAKFAGFRVTVMDDREEFTAREAIPEADERVVCDFGDLFSNLAVDENTYVVISTRGHLHDYEALKAALGTRARYIGLLGSRRKKAILFRKLMNDGYNEEDCQRVITPVGIPIGSVTPREIAISIVAQIIEERRKSESGLGSSSCRRIIEADAALETAPSP